MEEMEQNKKIYIHPRHIIRLYAGGNYSGYTNWWKNVTMTNIYTEEPVLQYLKNTRFLSASDKIKN